MNFEFMTIDTPLPPCMAFPRALTGFPVSSTAKVMYCRMLDAMMCEVQGAKEDFIRRWNLVFKDYPDVFEDNDCRSAILFLIDDTSAYLQTIKERVL